MAYHRPLKSQRLELTVDQEEEFTAECAESAEKNDPFLREALHAGTRRTNELLHRQGSGKDIPDVAKTGKNLSAVSALSAVSYPIWSEQS